MKRDREILFFYHWKSLKSHNGIPYTHRRESGNDTFQNMPQIFTGLENAFAGPGWAWKPHKSKDQIFLHRNYVQKISQLRKKNFFSRSKNFRIFLAKKITKMFPKNQKNRFQNFKILKILKF